MLSVLYLIHIKLLIDGGKSFVASFRVQNFNLPHAFLNYFTNLLRILILFDQSGFSLDEKLYQGLTLRTNEIFVDGSEKQSSYSDNIFLKLGRDFIVKLDHIKYVAGE